MRIIVVVSAVALALAAGPAGARSAQDALIPVAEAGERAPDPAREAHLELADRYLVLTQGGDLVKQMRAQIEQAYGEAGMPSQQRDWMVRSMGDVLAEVIDLTIAELRDDVADSFTVEELETAIAFYDSPTGRSIVRKQTDLNVEMQQVMAPLLIPRMASMMEKFCLRFDCEALGEAAAKQGR